MALALETQGAEGWALGASAADQVRVVPEDRGLAAPDTVKVMVRVMAWPEGAECQRSPLVDTVKVMAWPAEAVLEECPRSAVGLAAECHSAALEECPHSVEGTLATAVGTRATECMVAAKADGSSANWPEA